jgi:hypothetical protein
MKRNFKIATMAYLILLGVMLGATVYAGAVTVPVLSGSEKYLGTELLNSYQEGLNMTQNFVSLSYMILATLIAVFLYEGYKYKMFERDIVTTLAALGVIMTGMLFNYYYLPDITRMQLLGEAMTKSRAFVNTCRGIGIDFVLFAFFIMLLMIQNMRKACR